MQPVEKRPFWQTEKACISMETRPRTRKRLGERIPESLSNFALLVAGDAPSLVACFFSIRGRVSGTEFKIELKSSVHVWSLRTNPPSTEQHLGRATIGRFTVLLAIKQLMLSELPRQNFTTRKLKPWRTQTVLHPSGGNWPKNSVI